MPAERWRWQTIDQATRWRRYDALRTDLAAPYEIARVRRIGLACRALEDEDTARLELEAARRAFELGAARTGARQGR
jgi:hypothetical protein